MNLILTLVIIFILILCLNSNSQENFDTYTRCNKYKMSKIFQDSFKKVDLHKTNKDDWGIYYPCGYNDVEEQLKKLKLDDDKKKIFAISGCDYLASKSVIWLLLESKYGRNTSKLIMPNTYVLSKSSHLKEFKSIYNSNKKYIMKKNIQNKKGIKITNNLNEILNGKKEKFVVVQEYLDDLFLLNKRKINLRIYVLIICKNESKEIYFSNVGKCIYSNKDFNPYSTDNEVHLTSLNLNLSVYDSRPYDLSDLKGFIGDTNYEKLIFRIRNNILLSVLSSKNYICNMNKLKNNTSFQLFGLDYVFTKDFYPYLLEFNKGPEMNPKDQKDYNLKLKVLVDMFYKVGIDKEPTDYSNDFNMIYKLG